MNLAKDLGTWLLRAYRLVVEFDIAFTKPQTSNSDCVSDSELRVFNTFLCILSEKAV